MIQNHFFVANQFMTGAFAKFSNWNESIYLELCDELSHEDKSLLKNECNQHSSPQSYFYSVVSTNYNETLQLLKTYKGYGTIKPNKRNPHLIYAAIILTQYARMAYSCFFHDSPTIENLPEDYIPQEGNAVLAEKTFALILGAVEEINYWPFNE